ncbi:DsbA family oxidoreductase [Sphingomonas radiodurans]|uniref:DsbA family oxidoreductase n=1 Tax=Sphingomonas radiodurans TaxID=2890321 RepID=UPI001E5F0248|nr:DsbA family oxidoreductase [Sphingomonas radiodurans]WBH16056.1 DsbA family oxidoreductase [Sphingomonas radiodurans]
MSSRILRLDFVSDIVCPWCLIGLANLERALATVGDAVATELVFHPLQLNPGLPPEGELVADNIARKYGITPKQARERGGGVRAAAAEAGVSMARRSDRIYDTFDAHRLLHWARREGGELALKHALLAAYFTHGRNVSDHAVLADAAAEAGLDRAAAADVLARGAFATEVHDDEIEWRSEGITSVPTIVIDREFVISGAQEPARLERALRKLAAR